MFRFFRKKKLKEGEGSLNRIVFISRVTEIREKAGFPEATLPVENIVLFFAMNLAYIVFQAAKQSRSPEVSADAVEKAAMLIAFQQSAHMGARMAGINDKEQRAVIIENGMATLLQTDLHKPSPQAMAEMSLAITAYQALSADHVDILTTIDELSRAHLFTETKESLHGLVNCWRQVVEFLNADEGKRIKSA